MNDTALRTPAPVWTVPHFPALNAGLQTVLRGLTRDDWQRLTACAPWTVKDVAAHLLGGNFGRLWAPELGATWKFEAISFEALTEIINRENALWVQAARRISPEQLIDLLARTDVALVEHFVRLDPHAPAPIAVSWADDGPAPNWLDIAREYTEKWLHQQHIREAVGQPVLDTPELFAPVLAAFAHALPRALRASPAPDGATVVVHLIGPAGGVWSVVRAADRWQLFVGEADSPRAAVWLEQDQAWRLFTKGLAPTAARVRSAGDPDLAQAVLGAVAIMA